MLARFIRKLGGVCKVEGVIVAVTLAGLMVGMPVALAKIVSTFFPSSGMSIEIPLMIGCLAIVGFGGFGLLLLLSFVSAKILKCPNPLSWAEIVKEAKDTWQEIKEKWRQNSFRKI